MSVSFSRIAFLCTGALGVALTARSAEDPVTALDPLVVTTTPPSDHPLETTLDTQSAAQPIPAQDGADILKTVPGFSVSRKGGAGGEILLRGQAGSRVDLLLDGQSVMGGCPHRMDPPTAYVFPGSFDTVTVLKGPQTVLYGPGNSAGVVLFESNTQRRESTGANLEASATYGSFNRNDQTIHATAGTPDFYVKAGFDRTQSDDYEDGDGNLVHSQYDRSGIDAAFGWTPDENTVVELSGSLGRGEAAYASKSMDATQLDRENLGLLFSRSALSDLVSKLEARIAYNYADHIMDDFRLRTAGMMSMGEVRVDHLVYSGRVLAELIPADQTRISVGADFRDGRHRKFDTGTWVTDGKVGTIGLFAELNQQLSDQSRLIAGLRADHWRAKDQRTQIWSGSMMMGSYVANPTAAGTRNDTLPAGFVRYEQDLESMPATVYFGLGYTERAPDYWELFPNQSTTTVSSFLTAPEKTTQLDAGINYRKDAFSASVAVFANSVNDYILFQSNYAKGMSTATVTRNVDASSWGGELSADYDFNARWKLSTSLAYVEGRNHSDDLPLAQQPPLEGRIGLTYTTSAWTAGGLVRFVAEQDRYAVNQGTLVGQDIGATPGFAVFSLNAGWRATTYATLTVGVDNLFDKTYAEHVSTAGADVSGYVTTTRVNEPGRVVWIKLALDF